MHLKRQKTPKSWPIFRKGTKYVVRPGFSPEKGIPVLVLLRDILKVASDRKETKRAIYLKQVFVNNKPLTDEKKNVLLLDTLTLIPQKKYYRLGISEKGKFNLEEIKENESNFKISKIMNKKVLKEKKTQLNLNDGKNFLSEIDCKVGDSVLINFKERKIEKCIPLKEKTGVLVFAGKHSGKKGILKKIDEEHKITELEVKGESINVLIKQLLAVE